MLNVYLNQYQCLLPVARIGPAFSIRWQHLAGAVCVARVFWHYHIFLICIEEVPLNTHTEASCL